MLTRSRGRLFFSWEEIGGSARSGAPSTKTLAPVPSERRLRTTIAPQIPSAARNVARNAHSAPPEEDQSVPGSKTANIQAAREIPVPTPAPTRTPSPRHRRQSPAAHASPLPLNPCATTPSVSDGGDREPTELRPSLEQARRFLRRRRRCSHRQRAHHSPTREVSCRRESHRQCRKSQQRRRDELRDG